MVKSAIDAETAACDALALQAMQAGAQAFARLLKLSRDAQFRPDSAHRALPGRDA